MESHNKLPEIWSGFVTSLINNPPKAASLPFNSITLSPNDIVVEFTEVVVPLTYKSPLIVTLLPVTSIAPLIELENWFKESIRVYNELDNCVVDDDNELDKFNIVVSIDEEYSSTLPMPWIQTPSDGLVKFSILLTEPVLL